MKKHVLIFLAVFALIAAGLSTAKKINKDDSEATHVFVGKVASVDGYFGLNEWGDQLIFSLVKVKVEKKLKGELGDFVEFSVEGGSIGDRALFVSESSVFEAGETAKLFLKKIGPSFKLLKKEEVSGPQVLKATKGGKVSCCATFARWPSRYATYLVNPQQNDVSWDCAVADVKAGADAWSGAFSLIYGGMTPYGTVAADGKNIVFFRPGTSGSTIAVTYIWYSNKTKLITDFDTAFYVDAWKFFSYSDGGSGCRQVCSKGFYIQPIAAHELGHAIGLDHNNCVNSLMYPYADYCETGSPTADDLTCAKNLYK